jgi:hypothetical protein
MRVLHFIALAVVLLISQSVPAQEPPTAPDAAAPPKPPTALDASKPTALKPPKTGTYDVILKNLPADDITRQLQAVVYRPDALPPAAPVVIILHGLHFACGRPYNPATAPTPPQAYAVFTSANGTEVINANCTDAGRPFPCCDGPGKGECPAPQPIDIIPNPGVAGRVVIGFRDPYFVSRVSIPANKFDPPGLPCIRPAGGGPCMEGIRLDNWSYYSAATRICPASNARCTGAGAPLACCTGPGRGTCPVTEVPSYMGFQYLGLRLASQGYVVVSIDANRINNKKTSPTDFNLIQARGTLVLNHLKQLSTWTSKGGAPNAPIIPEGGLDLTHVALIGHSTGGEGMRAAYNMFQNGDNDPATGKPWAMSIPGLHVDSIFEIAPTDDQGQNAPSVAWNALLPMCDADVTNLAGVRAFDRMMRDFTETPQSQKSIYTVWGANHNFYNTQWKVSDSFTYNSRNATDSNCTAQGVPFACCTGRLTGTCPGGEGLAARFQFAELFPCTGGAENMSFPTLSPSPGGGPGSPNQRLTALSSVPALVRGNVGNAAVVSDPAFNQNFNTLFRLPTTVFNEAATPASVDYPPAPAMRVDRGYSPTAACVGKIPTPPPPGVAVMEDFNQASGTNTSGPANSSRGPITIRHLNGQGVLESMVPRGPNANCRELELPYPCCTGRGTGSCEPSPPPAPPAACFPDKVPPPATPVTSAPPAIPIKTCVADVPKCIPNHDESQRVAYIQWTASGDGVFFQTNWTYPNKPGRDVSGFATLDFRVSRNFDTTNNALPSTNFSIQLVGANGVLTRALQLADYAPVANDLVGPVGGGRLDDKNHPILQTYRIPLAHFGNFAAVGPQVSGVKFTFNKTAQGAIFLGNIRFVNTLGAGVTAYPALAAIPSPAGPPGTPAASAAVVNACFVGRPQYASMLPALGGDPGWIISAFSPVGFPNRDATPIMAIVDSSGNLTTNQFTLSFYPGSEANTLVFALTEQEFAALPSSYSGAQIQYSVEDSSEIWSCTALNL